MYQVVIIEDEPLAADDLENTLLQLDEDIQIMQKLDGVTESIEWFEKNEPDLILSDIQLGDGLSFDIFSNIDTKAPIIITTAFDQYAIRAFKENSVDYLLKPIDKEELRAAIQKFKKLKGEQQEFDLENFLKALKPERKQDFQERFIVTLGEKIVSIPATNVAYFFSEDRYTYLVEQTGKQHIINTNLGDLEGTLNPKEFYRINRKYIISYNSIRSMVAYSKSRVKIDLEPAPPKAMEVIVSVERSGAFKKWLNR